MTKTRIGKLKPRYSFMLNPYVDTRLSKCPHCEKLTFGRKFPLFIVVEGWEPLTLGMTCRWCNRCELIMAHKDELDAELARNLAKIAPEVVGNPYLVIGTIDKKVWKASVEGKPLPLEEALDHVADFKKTYDLLFDLGGWRHKDDTEPHWLPPPS